MLVEEKRAWDAIEVEEPEPGSRKHERESTGEREGDMSASPAEAQVVAKYH